MIHLKKVLFVLLFFCLDVFAYETTNGLVQKFDGRYPGRFLVSEWSSKVQSHERARLFGVGFNGSQPQYHCHTNGGGYDFGYTLDALDHNNDSGSIIDLGKDFLPDYDDDFAIEVWFRADGCPADNQQQVLWGTQSLGANGMRLYIYDWNGASGKFGIGFEARDNTNGKVKWYIADENGGDKYDYGQWMQVVAVYDAGAAGSGIPNMKIYTNGELKRDVDHTSAVPADTDFVDTTRGASAVLGARGIPEDVSFVAKDNRQYFDGGIALVRVYNKCLTANEIINNFNYDSGWIVFSQPYISTDPVYNALPQYFTDKMNLPGYSYLAESWQCVPGDYKWNPYVDCNADSIIDLWDLNWLCNNWLNETEVNRTVLYNNDTTHILTCVSPYHSQGRAFEPAMIDASVAETAGTGVTVHVLSPGLGWVPWWQSSVLPMGQQYSWFYQTYGILPNESFSNYVYSGGDIVQDFIDSCRNNGLSPFISYRLNDTHHLETVDPAAVVPSSVKTASQFYHDFPEYRLSQDVTDWDERVQNWAIEAVRDYKFDFISELCEKYDIDGLELDFLRHYRHFLTDGSITVETKKAIMTSFVADVRAVLDKTARLGKSRYLSIRVPCDIPALEGMGLDLSALVAVGVDMINLSNYYHMKQQNDAETIKASLANVNVYNEIAYTCGLTPITGSDEVIHRLATPEMINTAAHLAYSAGLDGVSSFNFQYYRLTGYEPPFEVFNHISDKNWVAAQSEQHYVIAWTYRGPAGAVHQLPTTISTFQTKTFTLKMIPPASGWSGVGRLRIMAQDDLGASVWDASINGCGLISTTDVSEPYSSPYTTGIGQTSQYRAWQVPFSCLVNGENSVSVTNLTASEVKLIYMDIAIQ